MNIDTVTQLHGSAVSLMKTGAYEAAMKVLRDILELLKKHEAEIVVDPDTTMPSRNAVHMFPVTCEDCTDMRSMGDFSLFQPWDVFCETNNAQAALCHQETMVFIVATLYNIGVCYQLLCTKHARTHYQQRAQSVYEIALRSLESLHAYTEFSSVVNLFGASIANNLGAIFADTFHVANLSRCVDIMEVYAQDLDWSWNWIYYNLFEWRDFQARHAAIA